MAENNGQETKTPGLGKLTVCQDLLKELLHAPDEIGRLINATVDSCGELVLIYCSEIFPNERLAKTFELRHTETDDGMGTKTIKGEIVIR